MDDRAKAGLRGPVSVCRTDVTLFSRGCAGNACDTEPKEQSHWSISHYHPDGRIAERRDHNLDGSEWTSTWTYDAGGKLREIENRESKGSGSKAVYQYDRAGRLERVVGIAADGAENIAETFSYADQHKTRTRYVPSVPGRPGSVAYSIEGSDAAVSAPGVASITTVYDRQDRPVETLFCDSQNRVLTRVALRYDDAGRLVEEAQFSEAEHTFPPDWLARLNAAQLESLKAIGGIGEGGRRWQRLHRYDDEGRRVETVSRMGALSEEREMMAYNRHGDVTESKTVCDAREISIDDEGHVVEPGESPSGGARTSEARYSYQYDEHGNWIERVISARHEPDKPFAVSSVDRRSLTYYPAA